MKIATAAFHVLLALLSICFVCFLAFYYSNEPVYIVIIAVAGAHLGICTGPVHLLWLEQWLKSLCVAACAFMVTAGLLAAIGRFDGSLVTWSISAAGAGCVYVFLAYSPWTDFIWIAAGSWIGIGAFVYTEGRLSGDNIVRLAAIGVGLCTMLPMGLWLTSSRKSNAAALAVGLVIGTIVGWLAMNGVVQIMLFSGRLPEALWILYGLTVPGSAAIAWLLLSRPL